jgi:putative membrane protein
MMGHGYGGGSYMGGEVLFHLLFGAIFFVILIAIAWILVRFALRGGRYGMHMRHSSSLELLKERYAKGEIDKREFEEKKKDLMA